MDLLANDLSIHEQFHDIASFHDALGRLMAMRSTAQGFGREVYCHRAFLTANPMRGVSMQQAIGRFDDKNVKRAAMRWAHERRSVLGRCPSAWHRRLSGMPGRCGDGYRNRRSRVSNAT